MNKLLIICGPTATGKTGLGIRIAKKFNGEIVSADSRQVYRGMDIGTGKDINKPEDRAYFSQAQNKQINKFQISNKLQISNDKCEIGYYEAKGIKIWLYDLVEPDFKFSVADYIDCAQAVIKNIWQRGKLPILVGGTGFYIKALIEGIETIGIEPNWELRKKLQSYKVSELQGYLKKIDSERLERMNESDRQNPRRLIRAIEIVLAHKEKKSQGTPGMCAGTLPVWRNKKKPLVIGLTTGLRNLYQRIDRRVEQRINQGAEEEIKELLKRGYSWENSALGITIGYQEWRPLLGSKKYEVRRAKLKAEIIQQWKFAEHAYARRQMTWFKKQKGISWFDITKKSWQKQLEDLVEQWYNGNKVESVFRTESYSDN